MRVHVWADDYGLWHARVTGDGAESVARGYARQAIRRELVEREATRANPNPRPRFRLSLVSINGQAREYAETREA